MLEMNHTWEGGKLVDSNPSDTTQKLAENIARTTTIRAAQADKTADFLPRTIPSIREANPANATDN